MTRLLVRNLFLAATFAVGLASASSNVPAPDQINDQSIEQKAVHEVRMYVHYTIWDNINIRTENGHVVLTGQVSQPFKKSDLQRLMQRVPGVVSVTNDLEVLPLSPNDDRLRIQVARAIYRDPMLSRYGLGTQPSIHVIVDNGHVTLEGVVSTETEKNVAGIRANGAGLSFGMVTNNLRVENPSKKKNG
jgi:hyperosmotically inducible periplasmic protein